MVVVQILVLYQSLQIMVDRLFVMQMGCLIKRLTVMSL